jgi:hypothetical protein
MIREDRGNSYCVSGIRLLQLLSKGHFFQALILAWRFVSKKRETEGAADDLPSATPSVSLFASLGG